ncbi:hypothetical protein JTE90_022050 [Oedothorax gibbosus]|uniref:Uncharacterized protein n=1 Tax=Oedothorax gibbosus TaxID=931172 RepID=A0AAV6V302_9ARAC|nr:hypothetical protein JTE90_022050 [Oedothorax gibbosus]
MVQPLFGEVQMHRLKNGIEMCNIIHNRLTGRSGGLANLGVSPPTHPRDCEIRLFKHCVLRTLLEQHLILIGTIACEVGLNDESCATLPYERKCEQGPPPVWKILEETNALVCRGRAFSEARDAQSADRREMAVADKILKASWEMMQMNTYFGAPIRRFAQPLRAVDIPDISVPEIPLADKNRSTSLSTRVTASTFYCPNSVSPLPTHGCAYLGPYLHSGVLLKGVIVK